ncbi:MAG: hypothetical protein GXO86_07700 [Chlorobi bacterium]|nr:hypothetical protein [Chlorobiota bacterium]
MKGIKLYVILISSLFLMLSISCSRKIHKNISSENIIIYPSPPDTTRIQYLTKISSSLDITGKRSGFARFLFGELPDMGIVKPYGLAIRDGKIYICDTQMDALEVINLEKHNFNYFSPEGMGQLKKPVNCFLDDDNKLYVADPKRRQIVVFNSDGSYLASFGEAENAKPTDVFVKDNKIWVANFTSHSIDVYNKDDYKLLKRIPDAEPGDKDFLFSPSNIYVTDKYVYVTDFGDFRIKVYTHDGEFVRSVGSYGKSIGQFVRPKGIAVDRDGHLYVVDAGFENIQIFDKDGNLLMFFGGPYKGPGGMWLPAKVVIDYDNLKYFENYVDDSFRLKYLIFVTNQYGPDKVNVYGYVEPK